MGGGGKMFGCPPRRPCAVCRREGQTPAGRLAGGAAGMEKSRPLIAHPTVQIGSFQHRPSPCTWGRTKRQKRKKKSASLKHCSFVVLVRTRPTRNGLRNGRLLVPRLVTAGDALTWGYTLQLLHAGRVESCSGETASSSSQARLAALLDDGTPRTCCSSVVH